MIHNAGKKSVHCERGSVTMKGSPRVRRITESGKFFIVECGILGFGIRVIAQGIREPTYD